MRSKKHCIKYVYKRIFTLFLVLVLGLSPITSHAADSSITRIAEATPEEVNAFLNAVKAIPSNIDINNVEEVGTLINIAFDAYGVMYSIADGLYLEREDVKNAYLSLEDAYSVAESVWQDGLEVEDSELYLDKLPGYEISDTFKDRWGNDAAYLYVGTYPNNPVYEYTNPATTVHLKVGETGSDQRLYTKAASCHCGNVLVEETPDWYAVDLRRKLTNSNPDIVKDIGFELAGYESDKWDEQGYVGYPSLQINCTGAKPGRTSVKFQAYQNYYYCYYWQLCNWCGQVYSEISFKGKWIEDNETVNFVVNADYMLNYDTRGGHSSFSNDQNCC